MNKDNLVMAAVVIALVFSSVAIFGGGIGPKGDRGDRGERGLGGASGPEYTNTQVFLASYESGSTGASQASTTLEVSTVLANFDWRRGIEYIEYTPTIGAVTLTTVASTTFQIGSQRGSKREIWLYNATTTTGAPSVITLAAGTGIDLQEETGEVVTFEGLEGMRITFIRKADSDIFMYVEATQVGD